jgi:hypothetical protein
MVETLQGAENGQENETNFGVERERQQVYEGVEIARQQGQEKVLEVLVYDWLGVPVLGAAPDEPVWYLTVSLNAVVK